MKTLRDTSVAAKLDMSPQQVWVLTKTDPGFPKPFKLSPRVTVWDEADINRWLATKKGPEHERIRPA